MNWTRVGLAVAIAGMVALGSTLGSAALAQEATPAAECPATTPEENAALAKGYWETVYNGREPSLVEEYLADDFARHNLARTHVNEPGFADDSARVEEYLADYGNLTISVDEVIASGDSVAVRMTWTGTHSDPIAPWNAPASGLPVEMTVMAFYNVECGKLAEQWIVFDYLSAMRQIGVITDDELATLDETAVDAADATADGTPIADDEDTE